MDPILFIDCCEHSDLQLDLSESVTGLTKFRGKFQEAESVNKNKRMYPYDVLNENMSRLQEAIKDRRLVGELDHPTDSIIHFADASHIVTKLWWDGNVLMGEGEILHTPHGNVLKALLNDGVKVGISSRGVGNGKVNEDGILVIGESYKLITFDIVADPSTFAAFQEKVVGTTRKESVVLPSEDETIRKGRNDNNSHIKNENTSIHNINKDALIACLGGIVHTQTQKFVSRLG
jgi:hypothetical protein